MKLAERHPLPWRAYNQPGRGWLVVDANNRDVVLDGEDDVRELAEIVNQSKESSNRVYTPERNKL